MGVLGPHSVHQHREIVLPFVGKHPPLERQEDLHGLGVLARGDVTVRQVEQLGHSFILFAEKPFEQLARALEISRSHERIAKSGHEGRVSFGGGKRFQQGCRADGIAGLQICLGIQKSDAALLRREFVSTTKKLERIGRGAARRSKLPGPQEGSYGKSSLAHAFGRFRKTKLASKILRIELGNPLAAEERVFVAAGRRE